MRKLGLVLAVATLGVVAASATAHSEMGVGVQWMGSGIVPNIVFPIKMESGMVLEPVLGFDRVELISRYSLSADEPATPSATQIRAGLSVSKSMSGEGATPLVGAAAMVHLNSPSDVYVGDDKLDSWTDFSVGVFLGGSATLVDGLDFVGQWGIFADLLGKQKAGGNEVSQSATNFGTRAWLTMRWYVWK